MKQVFSHFIGRRGDQLAMINNYQSYEKIENQVNTGDVIDLICEGNSGDGLTISDTWREIVSDLCGMM